MGAATTAKRGMSAAHWFYSLPSGPPSSDNLLRIAEEKAKARRFTGSSITGFGPLLPTDSLVTRICEIWGLDADSINAASDEAAREQGMRDDLQRDRDEANGDGPGQCVGGPR